MAVNADEPNTAPSGPTADAFEQAVNQAVIQRLRDLPQRDIMAIVMAGLKAHSGYEIPIAPVERDDFVRMDVDDLGSPIKLRANDNPEQNLPSPPQSSPPSTSSARFTPALTSLDLATPGQPGAASTKGKPNDNTPSKPQGKSKQVKPSKVTKRG